MYHYMSRRHLESTKEDGKDSNLTMSNYKGGGNAKLRDRFTKNQQANTRNTLICIFVAGTLILGVGISLTCIGFIEKDSFPNPFAVTGITTIVIGVCILLMSVEIIVKNRRETEEEGDKKMKRQWSNLVSSTKIHPVSSWQEVRGKEVNSWDSESVSSVHNDRTSSEHNRVDQQKEVVLMPNVLEEEGY